MQSFTDNAGRKWEVALDVTAVRRVLHLTGVDLRLVGAGDAKVLQELITDPLKLVDVLYAACKPQADALQVDDAAFGCGFAGDVLDAAVDALFDAVAAFFQKGRRALLQASWRKMRDGLTRAGDRALQELEKLDLDEVIRRVLSESSATSPAASASTPDRSPSAPSA
jgi:hypothetical protein